MNRFVKNNMVLLLLVGIAVVTAIVLAVFVVLKHAEMSRYMGQVESLKGSIAQLIRQKPAPVAGNLPLMEKDAEFYQRKAAEFQKIFGHPYKDALKKFVAELTDVKELTEDKTMSEEQRLAVFLQMLKSYWDESRSKGSMRRDQIYLGFKLSKINSKYWDKALNAFVEEARKHTLEPIDDSNKDDIFLQVIGIPRVMEENMNNCNVYRTIVRSKLIEYFGSKSVGFGPGAANFGFKDKDAFTVTDIPFIADKWEIIGDLGRRIANSGVNVLEVFELQGPLSGTKQGAYTRHRFKIVVRGELKNVRKLVELLYEGVKDRRFYYIRYMLLNNEEDAAVELLRQAAEQRVEDAKRGITVEKQDAAAAPGAAVPAKETLSKQEQLDRARQAAILEREKNLPLHERSGYGKVVIGANRFVRAVIVVDYITHKAE